MLFSYLDGLFTMTFPLAPMCQGFTINHHTGQMKNINCENIYDIIEQLATTKKVSIY